MVFKRFVSTIAAAAMALSAFAGLNVAVAADGEPTAKYTQDFETANDFNRNGTSASGRFYYGEDDGTANRLAEGNKVIGVKQNEKANKVLFPTYSERTLVSFDTKLDPGEKTKGSHSIVLAEGINNPDQKDRGDYIASATKDILRLTISSNGSGNGYFDGIVTVNGNSETTFDSKKITGTGSRISHSTVTERDSTGWMHVETVLDFSTHTMNIKVTDALSGDSLYSNASLAFSDNTATQLGGMLLDAGGTYGGVYIDNILIKDEPVAASIQISGDDRVHAGNSAEYTATVYDQYGDVMEGAAATLTAVTSGDITFTNGVLDVPVSLASYTEITINAAYGGVAASKTVSAAAKDLDLRNATVNVSQDTYVYGFDRVRATADPEASAEPTEEPDPSADPEQGESTDGTVIVANPEQAVIPHGSDGDLHTNMAINVLTSTSPGLKEVTKLALLQFDYTDYMGCTITSATLHYYAKQAAGTSSSPNFCRVSYDDWSESTITSSDFGSNMPYRGTNTPFKMPNVEGAQPSSGDYLPYSVDITEFFRADTNGEFVNDGILSVACYTYTARELCIASKEYEDTEAEINAGDYGAYIELEYIPPRANVVFRPTENYANTEVTVYDSYNKTVDDNGILLGANTYSYYIKAPGYETEIGTFTVSQDECNAGTAAAPYTKVIEYTLVQPAGPSSTNSTAPKTKTDSLFNESAENLYFVGNSSKAITASANGSVSNPANLPSPFIAIGDKVVMEFDIYVAKLTEARFELGKNGTVGPQFKFVADESNIEFWYGANFETKSSSSYSAGQWAHIKLEANTGRNTSNTNASQIRLESFKVTVTPLTSGAAFSASPTPRNLALNSAGNGHTLEQIKMDKEGAIIRNSEIYVLVEDRTVRAAYFVPQESSTTYDSGLTPLEGKYGHGLKGSTIATAFVSQSYIESTTTCLAWDVTVPQSGTYVRTGEGGGSASAVAATAAVPTDSLGYTIYSANTAFGLKLKYSVPNISSSTTIVFGLVLDNLYAPDATADVAYMTAIDDESLSAYDTLTLTQSAGNTAVYDAAAVSAGSTSETDAISELMSIDSILTMMYSDDELAGLIGDIASEDNAGISDIDETIDMTDDNADIEAVGDLD